jgi:hypothetical protein
VIRCSSWARSLQEPPIGTAAEAQLWLALEQPGPWGDRVLTDDTLATGDRAGLASAAAVDGVRPVLIRRPSAGVRYDAPAGRRLLVADTTPGRTRLVSAQLPDSDASALTIVDWAAVRDGSVDLRTALQAIATDVRDDTGPVLLVCTNGRRDACCALLGRPVAAALHDQHGDAVWETTHLGGHRLAPTGLLLPWGYSYAYLDPHSGDGLLAAARAGRFVAERLRGRSTWSRTGQAAEAAARTAWRAADLDAVHSVLAVPAGSDSKELVEVTHADGRRLSVEVRAVTGPARPEACGKSPIPLLSVHATVRQPS